MRRANSTMSSTLPSFGLAGAGLERAVVVAVVEHAEHVDVGVVLFGERLDQLLAIGVGADDHGAAVEPALARPAAHQRAQDQPLDDQHCKSHEEERGKPQPRDFTAELGEERDADEQQEHEGPGRDHPRHLPELAAEDLDLIDIGGLEADHRGGVHAEDRGDIFPAEPVQRHHIVEVDADADDAEQQEIDQTHHACDHDRRIGGAYLLVGDGQGRLRQPPPPFDRRLALGRHGRDGGRGIQHRACVDRFHCRPHPFLHRHIGARAPRRNPPRHGLEDNSEETVSLVNDG